MFKDDSTRQQAVAHAVKGNVSAMRQVFDDINERLDALEAGTAPPADVPAQDDKVPLDERIKIAIRMMDPATFGADGKPNARAIATALGEPVTAADRDRVWQAMQDDA